LKFASIEVLSAKIRVPSDWRTLQEYNCENGEIALPSGKYQIEDIYFKSGLRISYKNKIIEMIPNQETLVTFKLPGNSNLEVYRQGVYTIASYTPKGYSDEEFYYNPESPPVFNLYHNGRLFNSIISDYG
jgi:hypothetical protein